MKDLGKWQTISFVSRMLSKAIGMIPSIFIPRILSVSEFGVVGIAKSIGKTFGVTQNLGLASGSTREISQYQNTKSDVFKIFVTSTAIKYAISLPLAFALFFLADSLAVKYNNQALVIPLKIYSLILIVQNIQSLFNSVVQGMQRFKLLFTYQVLITIPNVILFIYFVYYYKVNGYFYASLVYNIFASVVLGILALWPLRHDLVFPSWIEFKKITKAVFVVSLAVYAVKVIYTFWEGIGPLILGVRLDSAEVGLFVFAALYAGQLMAVSDSITDVNLSVFSKQYSISSTEFKNIFMKNFNVIYTIVLFIATGALFWMFEITTLFYGDKYLESLQLIPPILAAFVFYSYVNIAKSSIFVPAKLMKELIFSYVLLVGATVLAFIGLRLFLAPTISMAIGMFIGALVSYMTMNFFSKSRLDFMLFNEKHLFLFFQSIIIILVGSVLNSYIIQFTDTWYMLLSKLFFYAIFGLLFYFGANAAGFIDYKDMKFWKKAK